MQYDADQAAYVVERIEGGLFLTSTDQPVCRPTFVVDGVSELAVRITADGHEVPCAIGVERSGGNARTVISVDATIAAGTQIRLQG